MAEPAPATGKRRVQPADKIKKKKHTFIQEICQGKIKTMAMAMTSRYNKIPIHHTNCHFISNSFVVHIKIQIRTMQERGCTYHTAPYSFLFKLPKKPLCFRSY